ncbi:SPOSA6832_02246, partial [Sporobolomyces salmonicolor]
MKELDSDFRSVLDRLKEVDIHSSMISDIRQRIVQGHQISDIYQMYLDRVHPLVASYAQQTSRQRFQGNPVYNDFRSLIWVSVSFSLPTRKVPPLTPTFNLSQENFTEGQGVPNIKKFLPKEIGDEEEDSDEELEIGAQTHDFKCPLTMAICEDPYTSTVCPHSFSGDAIKDYIRQNKGSVPCPVGGCSKTLSLATIEQDEGLRRRVEAHKRRVKEGRTQGTTQGRGRTFVAMEDSDDE